MLQEFVQQIKDTVDECLCDAHTAMPAKIVSVNTSSGLATVQPSIKKVKADGSTMDFPQISGVPIVLPQGANQLVSIAFPVKAGDSCLLIISEQSLEYWLYGRETDTTLMFDITNAICIPGLFQSPPDSFPDACDSSSIILDAGETRLTVGTAGIGVLGSLTVNGSLEVTGDATIDGSQSVKGGQTITGSQTVKSNLNVGGTATIEGDLNVSGTANI